MKKRGHKPDAHTYTIMLRGYTMNHKKPNAVEEAMKVYDSMWRPESNIKPSIIHSNAIIHCLGRALNMDALWSVAGRLPDRGPGAADKWTYTTILNTMQACAVKDAGQLAETDGDQDAAANVIQNAIGEGRRLWEDIVSRWRSGDVNIDQTLVCAMGRLLLLGQKQDWDDIFSLVEQTMRLPRLGPPRNFGMGEHAQEFEDALASPPSINEGTTSGLQQLEEAVADERSPKVKNEFAVVDLSDRPTKARDGSDMPSPYANVGNNVLSLLIEASIKLKAIPTGKAYWERLTNPENEPFVMPDDDNIRSYQRLLRLSRSSKEMIDLLRKPVNGALEGVWYRRATFVIAMSTCARDFKNPNVFTHASTILDLMQDKLPEPDLKVMTMYLSLAMVTTPGISTEIPGEFDARSGENNLIRAIRRFTYSDLDYRIMVTKWVEKHLKEKEEDQLDIGKSRSHLLKAKAARKAEQAPPNPPEGLVEFMQTLNSALDKLLQHSLKLTGKMATAFSNMKRDLSKSLQKLNPEALPPSIDSFYREEPVDELRDNEGPLKAKRYPDKLSKGTGRRMKGPRVVDLEKRHPFLMTESSQERRRSKRGSELTSSRNNDRDRPLGRTRASPSLAEGWSNAWKKSVEKMGNREKEKEWVVV